MAKKKETVHENEILCEGVSLSKSFYEEKENRLITLLVKGLVVYLLTMGSIGFYLSAYSISYNAVLVHVVVFTMAMLCAMLYYRLLVENTGYLIMLILFALLVINFKVYINSGFYAIVNITVEDMAQLFDVDVQKLYTEQIENRYVTVTFVALFIGIVLDIFLNVYISRRMQYLTAFFTVTFLNLIPLYATKEPSALYAIMLLAGMGMAYAFRSGKHYSPQVSVKRSSEKYSVNEKKTKKRRKKKDEDKSICDKKTISYVYDAGAMAEVGLLVLVFAIVIVTGARKVRPVENFNTGYTQNEYKELSMAAVATFMSEGFEGFIRNYDAKGGLDSGALGTVSSVKIDNQPDIYMQFTPYSYDSIYLKGFVGQTYNPYANYWSGMYENDEYKKDCAEAESLKDYYEEDGESSAEGVMRLRVVDGNSDCYVPYYTAGIETEKNGFYDATYYPYLEGSTAVMDSDKYDTENGEPYTEADLYVPTANQEAISDFIDELDWIGNDEQNIQAVIDYFEENYPYTINPGKTPKKKDFVNYFLQKKKKGYCSYYASAATLIFRAMGIPARYVEGYCVSYDQIIDDATLVYDKSYSDYYDGTSILGETAMIQVNVTDADAHAWVEVYSKERGWYVVDVTPASTEEEDTEDFWSMFDETMNNDSSDEDSANTTANINAIASKFASGLFYGIVGLFALSVCAWVLIRLIKLLIYYIRYMKAGNSDKAILRYQRLTRRYRRKNKDFANFHNYEEQLAFANEKLALQGNTYANDKSDTIQDTNANDFARAVDILERAGFSQKEITDSELEFVIAYINKLYT